MKYMLTWAAVHANDLDNQVAKNNINTIIDNTLECSGPLLKTLRSSVYNYAMDELSKMTSRQLKTHTLDELNRIYLSK